MYHFSNNFIQQLNSWGEQRKPFLLIVDFMKKEPILIALADLHKYNIAVSIQGKEYNNKKIESLLAKSSAPHQLLLDSEPAALIIEDSNIANFYRQQKNENAIALNYTNAFKQAQEQMNLGNTYLLNLTQKTKISLNTSLASIYTLANAKYKLYANFAQSELELNNYSNIQEIVSFSPETFIQIDKNKQIKTYPMKGTILVENKELGTETAATKKTAIEAASKILQNSLKESQEHNTIVDLLRNDLAMVATQIKVTKFKYIDEIITSQGKLLAMSSEIVGQLADNWQAQIGNILEKILPAGSICGAPKPKTLEIIENIEEHERQYYCGIFAVFDGESFDSAVTIRFISKENNEHFFYSGGGLTLKSQLLAEYQEIIDKIYLPNLAS